MSEPVPSVSAARLAALVKRSAELAKELKLTSEKMQQLTDSLAKELLQAKDRAEAAKKQARKN
jgi:hypothetical protein